MYVCSTVYIYIYIILHDIRYSGKHLLYISLYTIYYIICCINKYSMHIQRDITNYMILYELIVAKRSAVYHYLGSYIIVANMVVEQNENIIYIYMYIRMKDESMYTSYTIPYIILTAICYR